MNGSSTLLKTILGEPKRRSKLVLGLFIAVFVGAGLYYLFRPLSPDAVCARTVHALETQDVQALLALADPQELKELNLSAYNVRAILDETAWHSNSFRAPHVIRVPRRQEDQALYNITGEANAPMYVPVVDSPTVGWRLDLSALLYYACFHQNPEGDFSLYHRLSRQYNIWGIRQPSGEYTYNELKPGAQHKQPPSS